MPGYDVIIRGGTLVDGTGMPRRRADVGIRGGRIAALGRLGAASARQVVDAEGMIVAPGFIDLHTHYDAQIFWDPHLSLSGWHGVTSVVIGNCGFGFAPVAPEMRDRSMLGMTRNEAISYDAMKEGMPWDWVTFPEFLDSLERTPKAINLLPYVPLTPLPRRASCPAMQSTRKWPACSTRPWTRGPAAGRPSAHHPAASATPSATTTARPCPRT
jgi:N-acyl-D-aspartate/D-glutamate deacylase